LAIDTPLGLKAAYGHTQLRVWPRDEAAGLAIAASYAQHIEGTDGALVLKPDADAFVDTFLARYGNRVRQLSLVEPSLETVFLALTGRELRDKAANDRQRTFAFGRRGGEYTR
jgi:ABC-2 type transport system ATP-binding protein